MTGALVAMLAVLAMAGPTPTGVPPNMVIPAVYRPVVAEMFRYSPTFRRQCGRLARASDLQIDLTPSMQPGLTAGEALTRIVRLPGGVMKAGVQIGPVGDPSLLIAHEFEHILEQLDGVDLPAMATRVATGVRLVRGSGHFETERAIAAGRRVAEEVNRGRMRRGL
jgi:hypothetical protein